MKEKNVKIITINDDHNYGNRLQNYALHLLLLRYSQNETLRIEVGIDSFVKMIRLLVKTIVQPFYRVLAAKLGSLKHRRLCAAEQFTRQYIPTANFRICAYNVRFTKHLVHAKGVVIGSDQVWNYHGLTKQDLALRLGAKICDNVPIISYAASVGVSEIDDEMTEVFKDCLPHLSEISVREYRGKDLIHKIADLDVSVVLDPTLMITTDQWVNITRGFVSDNDRYILTYFLGKLSSAQEETIRTYAKDHCCRIRRIADINDHETYVAGPQDFVELFIKAEYVFTDSYHACCFAILNHKQFTVFNRSDMNGKANMNSRMETLFRLFNLNMVLMNDGVAPTIDYEKVDKLLELHRQESLTWLDKAMEVMK